MLFVSSDIQEELLEHFSLVQTEYNRRDAGEQMLTYTGCDYPCGGQAVTELDPAQCWYVRVCTCKSKMFHVGANSFLPCVIFA